MHPLPKADGWLRQTRFALALYKYFSYRFVWSDDHRTEAQQCGAWMGAGPPHGVLPLANVLSIPAINSFNFCKFVGAPASVVFNTPFLRYMTLFGCVDVGAKSITKAIDKGTCVGLVPDGIAGIFRLSAHSESVFLANRKGLAKLSLRTGTPIVPAYSMGNTAHMSALFDRWGIMESLSRQLQASLFVYYGRWGLPVPRRSNITMLIGKPILVEKVVEPTAAQVDALHAELLEALKALFDAHKDALGWGDKQIKFV